MTHAMTRTTGRAGGSRLRALVVLLVAAALLCTAALGADRLRPDDWQRLIRIGDILAAGGRPADPEAAGLSARAAYLLAFHHAQDAEDLGRMLAAADRLDQIGEAAAARHVRQAVASMAANRVVTDRARWESASQDFAASATLQ